MSLLNLTGVGASTAERLSLVSVHSIKDLANLSNAKLRRSSFVFREPRLRALREVARATVGPISDFELVDLADEVIEITGVTFFSNNNGRYYFVGKYEGKPAFQHQRRDEDVFIYFQPGIGWVIGPKIGTGVGWCAGPQKTDLPQDVTKWLSLNPDDETWVEDAIVVTRKNFVSISEGDKSSLISRAKSNTKKRRLEKDLNESDSAKPHPTLTNTLPPLIKPEVPVNPRRRKRTRSQTGSTTTPVKGSNMLFKSPRQTRRSKSLRAKTVAKVRRSLKLQQKPKTNSKTTSRTKRKTTPAASRTRSSPGSRVSKKRTAVVRRTAISKSATPTKDVSSPIQAKYTSTHKCNKRRDQNPKQNRKSSSKLNSNLKTNQTLNPKLKSTRKSKSTTNANKKHARKATKRSNGARTNESQVTKRSRIGKVGEIDPGKARPQHRRTRKPDTGTASSSRHPSVEHMALSINLDDSGLLQRLGQTLSLKETIDRDTWSSDDIPDFAPTPRATRSNQQPGNIQANSTQNLTTSRSTSRCSSDSSPTNHPTSTPLSHALSTPLSDALSTPLADALYIPLSEALSTPLADALSTPLSDALSTPVSDALSTPRLDALSTPLSDAFSTSLPDTFSVPCSDQTSNSADPVEQREAHETQSLLEALAKSNGKSIPRLTFDEPEEQEGTAVREESIQVSLSNRLDILTEDIKRDFPASVGKPVTHLFGSPIPGDMPGHFPELYGNHLDQNQDPTYLRLAAFAILFDNANMALLQEFGNSPNFNASVVKPAIHQLFLAHLEDEREYDQKRQRVAMYQSLAGFLSTTAHDTSSQILILELGLLTSSPKVDRWFDMIGRLLKLSDGDISPKMKALLYRSRSSGWRKCKKVSMALKDITEALKLDPSRVEFYFERGEILLKYVTPPQCGDAIHDFKYFLENSHEDNRKRKDVCFYLADCLKENEKSRDEGRRYFDQALKEKQRHDFLYGGCALHTEVELNCHRFYLCEKAGLESAFLSCSSSNPAICQQ